jgi:tripartite-type tricarboxylate transporter receptor subunit TctC
MNVSHRPRCLPVSSPTTGSARFASRRRALRLVLPAVASMTGATLGSLPMAVRAQSWPARPIRLVIPFPPGGATDVIGRILAQRLGTQLGQQVLVENRPGAGGTLGSDAVAKSAPDGYTLLLATGSTHSVGPALTPGKLPYNAFRDFTPIVHVANAPSVLVVGRDFPARTLQEAIALMKAAPGRYNFGSSGIGTYPHLGAELFKWRAGGLYVVHIPYRGTQLVIGDLVSGQVAFLVDSVVSAQPNIRDGRVRALAVTGLKRAPQLPTVPTFAEAGVQGMGLANWFGLFGPAGLPREVADTLRREVNAALKAPDLIERFDKIGAEAVGGSAEQFLKTYTEEYETWKAVIARAGIKPES